MVSATRAVVGATAAALAPVGRPLGCAAPLAWRSSVPPADTGCVGITLAGAGTAIGPAAVATGARVEVPATGGVGAAGAALPAQALAVSVSSRARISRTAQDRANRCWLVCFVCIPLTS